jgi:Ala-tRNA(Pro) deacylase
MPIPKKVIDYLEEKKVKYETIEHKIVFTAWDLVQTLHLKKPSEVAKTLIVRVNKQPAVILLPADKNLDKVKFIKVINKWLEKTGDKKVKAIDFIKEAWLKNNVKVGKLGAVPPFGKLLGWPIFIDQLILKQTKIIINSGDYNFSLKIKSKDLIKIEQPVVGSFSKKK